MITEWIGSHSLLVLLTAGTIFTLIWLLLFRERLKISALEAVIYAVIHTAWGVFCVKFFAVLETADLNATGNMSLFGGVFFMPLLYLIIAKLTERAVKEVFDICTICMIFTVMCARINCIIGGCCQGKVIAGLSLRWPTREAEVFFYIVLLFALGRKVKEGKTRGEIYPIYMISYGIFRFLTEFFRDNGLTLFHLSHLWALLALGIGGSIYIELKSKTKERREKKR